MDKKTDTTKPYLKISNQKTGGESYLVIPSQRRAELLSWLLNFVDDKATKKVQLLDHLLNNVNRENMVIVTVDELFNATGLSKPFILGVLKNLEQMQVIARRNGVIKFNHEFLGDRLQIIIEVEGGNG